MMLSDDGANAQKNKGGNAMGCDIHLYIEHKHKDSEIGWWRSFGGEHRLDRDYGMFARMANVRNYGNGITPIFKPRGLPSDISWEAKDGNRILIIDSDEAGEKEVTREQAERWVNSGSSKLDGGFHVTNPDWHSHSWLTSQEFEQCIDSFDSASTDYKAVLAVMRSFESEGEVTRLVFWFDN
jgi:hypothetical protein